MIWILGQTLRLQAAREVVPQLLMRRLWLAIVAPTFPRRSLVDLFPLQRGEHAHARPSSSHLAWFLRQAIQLMEALEKLLAAVWRLDLNRTNGGQFVLTAVSAADPPMR